MGKNRYSAGRGDDTIRAVNGRRERVNCGPGKDRAVVDATDTAVGCETVKRR
jgi:UDP-N-acetylmuramyl tripeptide synthase